MIFHDFSYKQNFGLVAPQGHRGPRDATNDVFLTLKQLKAVLITAKYLRKYDEVPYMCIEDFDPGSP